MHLSTHDKREMEKLQKKMQKELLKKNKMTKKTEIMYKELEEIKEGMAREDQFLERFKKLNEQNHNPSLSKINFNAQSRSTSPTHKKPIHHHMNHNDSKQNNLHNNSTITHPLGESHSKVTFSLEHQKY